MPIKRDFKNVKKNKIIIFPQWNGQFVLLELQLCHKMTATAQTATKYNQRQSEELAHLSLITAAYFKLLEKKKKKKEKKSLLLSLVEMHSSAISAIFVP